MKLDQTSSMKSSGTFRSGVRVLTSVSRASDWWEFKVPVFLAVAYAAAYSVQMGFATLWPLLLVIAGALVVGASYVSILNDITDEVDDLRAGKSNRMSGRSTLFRCAALGLCLAAGAGFGWLLRGSIWTLLFYSLNWVVFTLYSVPPVRLKGRGAPGVLADASGGQLLPSLWITSLIVSRSQGQIEAHLFGALAVWASCLGLRGILHHQACDFQGDQVSGVRTLATRLGLKKLGILVACLIFPLEIVALWKFLTLIHSPVAWPLIALSLFFQWAMMHWMEINPVVILPSSSYRVILFKYYVTLFPLTFILSLALSNPWLLALIPAHAFLFPGGWDHFFSHWLHIKHNLKYPASRPTGGSVTI